MRSTWHHLFVLLALVSGPSVMTAVAQPGQAFPDSYYYKQTGDRTQAPRDREGDRMPALSVDDWVEEPTEKLAGRVIVIAIWALESQPSVSQLPKLESLWQKHRDDGLTVIGVHGRGAGAEAMDLTVGAMGVSFPCGVDTKGDTVKAFGARFYPTLVAIDHTGVIRAAGFRPAALDRIVTRLLKERNPEPVSATPPPVDPLFRRAWMEGDNAKRARLTPLLEQSVAPELGTTNWANSPPLSMASLRGKVVLLDFWATWCEPCLDDAPKLNQLARKYEEQGLVIIGVCEHGKLKNPETEQPLTVLESAKRMADMAVEHWMTYPICLDSKYTARQRYQVDGFPDYYLIDRQGRLRAADIQDDSLEAVVKTLLDE